MEKTGRAKVYVAVDVKAVSKHPSFEGWAMISNVTENDRITAEVEMVRPDISLCLVAGYLKDRNKADGSKKTEVIFNGKIRSIFVSQIKRIILR